MERIPVGIVGVGKIAREQHIPTLEASVAFRLAACASRTARVDGIETFARVEDMLAARPDLKAVAICTPPQAHYEAARVALQHRLHVLLEKPPCTTTAQFDHLVHLARRADRTLYQTWHARHTAAVAAARRWLGGSPIRKGRIAWKEDVRHWHPGQTWIWQRGGFGVLDAGINAVSILTEIAAEPVFVQAAQLMIPSNCESPVAASVTFATDAGAVIEAEFDFRGRGDQACEIEIETDRGRLMLAEHGNSLFIDGGPVATEAADPEYTALYLRFAEMIARHESEVDRRPFQLVADIFMTGRRSLADPFEA